jgi:hypothetical protein
MRIPFISKNGMDSYFRSMDSKLSAYEGSTILELAIWKSEIVRQTDGVINLLTPVTKMGCRIDSLSMVDIIVPNVLSFLHDDANEGDEVGDDDNGEDDDGSDEDEDDSDKDDGDGDNEY